MSTNKQIILLPTLCMMLAIVIFSCNKPARPALGDYPKDGGTLPGGNLRFFVPFGGDNPISRWNMIDSISTNPPFSTPFTLIPGVNGKGVKGADQSAIKYLNANDFSSATSCTISLWVNNTVNSSTELLFSLVDNKDYWHGSAAFLLVEHAKPDVCTFKFALQDHWVEYNDNFNKPLFNGQWHHLAFTYDETTSTVKVYYDGVEVPLPAGAAGNFAGLGKLNLKNATNLVLGGWNKHVGLPGPTDSWIQSWQGGLDQFRLYNKALTATEVMALFNSKL